jgi:hypothetical protein
MHPASSRASNRPRLGSRAAALVLAALAVGLAAPPAFAGRLSFDEWLARQGTRCKDLDHDGKCCEAFDDQYIPASKSYLYWFSPDARNAVIDYLGLSAAYLKASCGIDLGTSVAGSATAQSTRDGRVLVSVRGHTFNALAFVADGFDPTGMLLFGAREADICEGAAASLVDVEFGFEYYTDPAQPIVDLQWFGNPPPVGCETADEPFDFRRMHFRAHGDGLLPDGTPANLRVNQNGILQSQSKSKKFDGFPVEFIEIHPQR